MNLKKKRQEKEEKLYSPSNGLEGYSFSFSALLIRSFSLSFTFSLYSSSPRLSCKARIKIMIKVYFIGLETENEIYCF